MATDKIAKLVEDGIVDELVQRVKTGKEAEVFVVRKGADFLAAKVYKDRNDRNFKNNAGYREGRAVRNSRDRRAMEKGSKYGVEKAEDEWMHTEHDACVALSAVGVRVPKAELFYEGVFLMELVLDANGQPAPRLIEMSFTPEDALAMYADLIDQIVRMMLADRIHGDLSPYNILLAWNGATIIDFPQVVSAAHNSQAERFLVRDVRNVTEFFARFVPALKARANDGFRIWRAYEKRELVVGFVPADHPEYDRPVHERSFTESRGPREYRPRPQGEARPPRPAGEARPSPPAGEARPPRPPHEARPPRPEGEARPPRPHDARPPREARPPRPEGEVLPPRPHDARPPREARPPRPEGEARPPRPHDARPPREARPPRPEGEARPPRPHDARPPREPRPPRPEGEARPPRPHDARAPRPHDARPPREHRPEGERRSHGQAPAAAAHRARPPGGPGRPPPSRGPEIVHVQRQVPRSDAPPHASRPPPRRGPRGPG